MFNNIINRELDPHKFANEPEMITQMIDDALRTNDMAHINSALRMAARAKALSRLNPFNDKHSGNDNMGNQTLETLDEKMRAMSCVGMRLHLNREPRTAG